MKAAAAESILDWRFLRDTSISISARSAATVESRSSQNRKGRSRHFCDVADEGPGRLRARPFAAIHVDRQPDRHRPDIFPGQQGKQRGGVEREFLADDHRARMGEREAAVGNRDADRLVTEVEPGECLAGREATGQFLDRNDGQMRRLSFDLNGRGSILRSKAKSRRRPKMKLTWYGHSAFRVEVGDARILIDPYFTGNPSWNRGWEGPAEGVTHVLLTHGHGDHVGDAAEILEKTGAMLVANFEVCMFLVGKGVSQNRINPGNHGGTIDCDGFMTTFVNALHSSSYQGDGGSNTYLGNPPVSFCISAMRKRSITWATPIFSRDMALINELHEPKIGIVPIGDRFTMGGAVAALACRRFFNFETVLPCHYGTFASSTRMPTSSLPEWKGRAST